MNNRALQTLLQTIQQRARAQGLPSPIADGLMGATAQAGGGPIRPGDKPDRFMNPVQFDKRFGAFPDVPLSPPVDDETLWRMLMRRQQMMNGGEPPLQGEMVGAPWPQNVPPLSPPVQSVLRSSRPKGSVLPKNMRPPAPVGNLLGR